MLSAPSLAQASELKFWMGRELPAEQEQFVCIKVTNEQQYHGGLSNVLFMRFDTQGSVTGAVSINGRVITEFNYTKGDTSSVEVNFSGSDFPVGSTAKIGVLVNKPAKVEQAGFRINTVNDSGMVRCADSR
jgi:hypothetical protein